MKKNNCLDPDLRNRMFHDRLRSIAAAFTRGIRYHATNGFGRLAGSIR